MYLLIAGLRRRRVDLLRRRLDVVEVLGEVGGQVYTGPPKTRAGRRSVSLPRSIAAELAEHMSIYTPAGADALVFGGAHGGPLRRNAFRRRVWQPAVAAAGLDPLRVHDLRHTAVALWIESAANLAEIARRAGHTSPAFTISRYGHLFPDADERLADRLDVLAAGARPATSGQVRELPT